MNSQTDFTIDNIPFGIISTKNAPTPRVATAFGDNVIDLCAVAFSELFTGPILKRSADVFYKSTLNDFIALGKDAWHEARVTIQELIRSDEVAFASIPIKDVTMHLPVAIGDYTDFYASKEHATNVGQLFRPNDPLMPNWVHIPVGYHGRASSVVVSGTDVCRPKGIIEDSFSDIEYLPSSKLDFELELGFIVGKNTQLGTCLTMDEAEDAIFGMVLLNDWSARDIQRFEYQPLGPFLGKSFATTISPWIITMEALEPFRCSQVKQKPIPQRHLQSIPKDPYDLKLDSYDINLTVHLNNRLISTVNAKHLYWSIKQMLVHHTSNGCNVRVGDLMGTGTISNPSPSKWTGRRDYFGSLLESTLNGEEGDFLNDDDEITFKGVCRTEDGQIRIGFGECTGIIKSVMNSST